MAKQLKSIKFPGLEDTYLIPQKLSDLEQDIDTGTLKPDTGLDSMIPVTTSGATGTGDKSDPTPQATNRATIALGRYTRATGKQAMAVNYQSRAYGENSFVANSNNEVNAKNSAAFGHSNTINATNADGSELEAAFVVGTENTASKSNQTVIGAFSKADEKAAFIIGDGSQDDKRSNAFVVTSTRNNDDTISRMYSFGNIDIDEATFNLMSFDAQHPIFQRPPMGEGTNDHSILQLENENEMSGSYSVALGRKNIVSSNDSMAVGRGNTTMGHNSFVANANNTVKGLHGTAFGYSNTVRENTEAGFAIGMGTIASSSAQMVQGTFNVEDVNNKYAHIVGGGSHSNDRKNIHTLDWDGNAVYAGKVTAGAEPTEDMDLTTKVYVDNLCAKAGDPVLKSGTGLDSMMPAATSGSTGTGDEKDPEPQATNRATIALGRYTRATGKQAMAVNYQSKAYGENSFVANSNNEVNATNSAAFGHSNIILGTNADGTKVEAGFVAGTGNTVSKSNQTVLGTFNEQNDDAIFIIGDGSEKNKRHNAFTIRSVRNDDDTVTRTFGFGRANVTESTFNLMAFDAENPLFQRKSMGGTDPHMILQLNNGNTGCGYSVVLGRNNTVSGSDSIALGIGNTVEGLKSFAVNSLNTVSGEISAAFGNRNEVQGTCNIALGGNNNKVLGTNSVVAGHMNISNGNNQFVVGVCNIEDSDALFIVGNGTSNDIRSNAFVVNRDGTVKINDVVMPTIYSGTEEPDKFEGKDGDIYIMYEE